MAKLPVTPAIRALRAAKLPFELHEYEYVPRGGTEASSAALGVDEHVVIKTLVFEDEDRRPLIVLMHGDREVSGKELARVLERKRVVPCDPAAAEKHTGYQVGGTSPFGLRRPLPIYVEATILGLERIYINGGRRGLLVSLTPSELARVLAPTPVSVAR
jgi:Cys-tRNA(Pro) deacylase